MKRIEIRLSEENAELIEHVAYADNVPVSAWVVQQALSAARRHPAGRDWMKAAANKLKAAIKDAEERAARIEHYKSLLPRMRDNVRHDHSLWQEFVKRCDANKKHAGFAAWVAENNIGPTDN